MKRKESNEKREKCQTLGADAFFLPFLCRMKSLLRKKKKGFSPRVPLHLSERERHAGSSKSRFPLSPLFFLCRHPAATAPACAFFRLFPSRRVSDFEAQENLSAARDEEITRQPMCPHVCVFESSAEKLTPTASTSQELESSG